MTNFETTNGKIEFNYEDVLLYHVVGEGKNRHIVMLPAVGVNLELIKASGVVRSFEVGSIPYSVAEENNVAKRMKQITSCKTGEVDGEQVVIVNYDFEKDDVKFPYAMFNDVKRVYELQKGISVIDENNDSVIREFRNRSKEDSKGTNKTLIAFLAAFAVIGGTIGAITGTLTSKDSRVGGNVTNDTNVTDTTTRMSIGTDEVASVPVVSQYLEQGRMLYEEVQTKNPRLVFYIANAGIKWSEELAVEIVETMNNVYPTAMANMNEENARLEEMKIKATLAALTLGNMKEGNDISETVNLSEYVENDVDRAAILNATIIARNATEAAKDEPMNGKILDEDAFTSIASFSRKYKDNVQTTLNYEYDKIKDSVYTTTVSPGARLVVYTIFDMINAENMLSTGCITTDEGNKLYCEMFVNTETNVVYTPKITKDGMTQFVGTDGSVYSYPEMFDIAGMSLDPAERFYQPAPNSSIVRCGLFAHVEDAIYKAESEFFYGIGEYGKGSK